MGWEYGSDRQKIGYNFGEISSNSTNDPKVIAGVYGWTCGSKNRTRYPKTKAQEYYIVDSWGGNSKEFVPWDEVAAAPAKPLRRYGFFGSEIRVEANDGIYKVYKVQRDGAQACGDGKPRKFEQFWSVRTESLAPGTDRDIDFADHDNTWDNYGFSSNKVQNGYQILKGEAFGHQNFRHVGVVDGSVWSR